MRLLQGWYLDACVKNINIIGPEHRVVNKINISKKVFSTQMGTGSSSQQKGPHRSLVVCKVQCSLSTKGLRLLISTCEKCLCQHMDASSMHHRLHQCPTLSISVWMKLILSLVGVRNHSVHGAGFCEGGNGLV